MGKQYGHPVAMDYKSEHYSTTFCCVRTHVGKMPIVYENLKFMDSVTNQGILQDFTRLASG